jgi:hypothetical protein
MYPTRRLTQSGIGVARRGTAPPVIPSISRLKFRIPGTSGVTAKVMHSVTIL